MPVISAVRAMLCSKRPRSYVALARPLRPQCSLVYREGGLGGTLPGELRRPPYPGVAAPRTLIRVAEQALDPRSHGGGVPVRDHERHRTANLRQRRIVKENDRGAAGHRFDAGQPTSRAVAAGTAITSVAWRSRRRAGRRERRTHG